MSRHNNVRDTKVGPNIGSTFPRSLPGCPIGTARFKDTKKKKKTEQIHKREQSETYIFPGPILPQPIIPRQDFLYPVSPLALRKVASVNSPERPVVIGTPSHCTQAITFHYKFHCCWLRNTITETLLCRIRRQRKRAKPPCLGRHVSMGDRSPGECLERKRNRYICTCTVP